MVTNTDAIDPIRQAILLGKGGSGKTLTINAVTYTLEQRYGVGCVLRFAPTGKAACLIGGSTLHSFQSGIALPISAGAWKKLAGETLTNLQENFRHCRLAVVDEFSMMKACDVFFMSERLKQLKVSDDIFGGLCVVFVGDPAQIPPPCGDELWKGSPFRSDFDLHGNPQ